ncbi:MAG: hypothetical protein ACLQU2_19455 [Candidatus Binataceae bacterium]
MSLTASQFQSSADQLVSADEILAETRAFIRAHTVSEAQAGSLDQAVAGLSIEAAPTPLILLPQLVYGAITGNFRPARPLCVATTFLFTGIDILDDIADGDLPAHWSGHAPSQIQLAATTLISALPQLAISRLNASPESRAAMHRTLAAGLLRMAAGQAADLANAGGASPDPDLIEASVVQKSGEEGAMFAALAAQLAGATHHLVELYAGFARAFVTAGQLSSDCYDLFTATLSKDLANGSRTLPIALGLGKCAAGPCEELLALLAAARTDPDARQGVRERLIAAGAVRMCGFVIEVYCSRARSFLVQAKPTDPAAAELRALISHLSLFAKEGDRQ